MYKLFHIKSVVLLLLTILFLSGCSSYGVITNRPHTSHTSSFDSNYSIKSVLQSKTQGKIALVLSFSGGGTRAAALAYGVLQELNETKVRYQKKQINLLDEVDIISAVSGGSFLAAYYGLNGQRTFKDFEKAMLKKDIEDKLISGLLNPLNWFSDTGRTELAIQLYDKTIFEQATFGDLNKPGRPLILINATDLANGVRFSFTQEYFDLICSDINSLSVAKAVTASSAVPVLFNPVTIKNYQPCSNQASRALAFSEKYAKHNYELRQTINGLKDYTETNYPYLHLVDGGITDNLGLRAIYEAIELSGGAQSFMHQIGKQNIKHIAVISVDASTQSAQTINQTNKSPTIEVSVNAMTDIQLHRYNISTTQLFEQSLEHWATQLSKLGHLVKPYFVQLSFNQLKTPDTVSELNLIPTRLSLTEPDITKLIHAGRTLLKNNYEFQQLLHDLDQKS